MAKQASLTNSQKKYLKTLGHKLAPVVMVAEKGLSENVMVAIDEALSFHELIKVRIRLPKEERQELTPTILAESGCELVTSIGQIILIYRPTKANKVELPGFKASR